MKSASIVRFVLWGAAGFCLGGVLLGLAGGLVIPVSGAVGGASLGLALGDMRKAVALGLLGALGFSIGVPVAFILGFLGFVPSSEYGALGAMGVLAGAVGGAALGLAFRDWRWIAILSATCSLGVCAGLTGGLSMLRLLGLPAGVAGGAILFAVAGIICGASLGATLRIREWAAGQSRASALLPPVALAGMVLLAGLFTLFLVVPYANICSDEERAAFAEFPQYGGVEREPQSDPASSGCAVFYETSAPPEEVAEYFARRLEAHGWTVDQQFKGGGEENFGGTLVTAHRDGFRYDAVYESLEFYDPPRPGTHVAVHLWKEE